MNSIAVLAARTNSSRLPGKVLLPLAGLPLVVLAALRAANTGRKVIVATSVESTDDNLVEILIQHGVSSYRGSLNNTLKRIVDALESYPEETLVFRLTADNSLPDGQLLDEMEAYFREKQLRYLSSNGSTTGLPYGVSAELFYLSDLRTAMREAREAYDQEHVTPYIRRHFGDTYFQKYRALGMSHYRATIDCFDEYLSMKHVFKGIANPISTSLPELINRLKSAPFQPVNRLPALKLVLGTAQLGLNYGVSNKTGKPDQATATELIKLAISSGITALDTARGYGNSERVIGRALEQGWQDRAQVITKLALINDCDDDATPETVAAFVDASVFRSCTELGTHRLDVLMLHRVEYKNAWNGAAWLHLQRLVEKKIIKALGVSVQTPTELELCLHDSSVTYIQLPFNILDWRWDELIPAIRKEKSARNLVIHARSAFLQGLLLSPNLKLWQQAGIEKPKEIFSWLKEAERFLSVETLEQVCLSYCLSQDWIDGVVIGVETKAQLRANLAVVDNLPPDPTKFAALIKKRPKVDAAMLNPATWKTTGGKQ